jgi:outer membrane receptor protein involved in Fe transport
MVASLRARSLVLPLAWWLAAAPLRAEGKIEVEVPATADPALPDFESVVPGRRPPLSAGATAVGRAEIEAARPGSGSEALGLVPGLRIVQHGAEGKGHQLFLRGFDAVHGSDVEIRLGGVPLNERMNVHGHGYADLYGAIPEAVREIRVHKGPFLPWQGDFATAGSVAVELGLPRELRPGLVRTEVSHRGRLRGVTVAAPEGAPEDTLVAVEGVYDAGFGPDREAARAALLGAWSWDLPRDLELRALGSAQTARFESPGVLRLSDVEAGTVGFHGSYGPAGRGESDRVLARLALARDRAGSDLEIGVHGAIRRLLLEDDYTGRLMDAARGDRKRQEQAAVTAGADTTLEHSLGFSRPAALLAGLGWRVDAGRQRERQVTDEGTPWRANRDLDGAVHGLFAWAGFRLHPWDWIEFLPSIRGDLLVYAVDDRLEDRGGDEILGVVSPRLAVAFPVHRAVTLFVDYGRGLRSPEPRAMTAPEPGAVEDESLAPYAGGRPAIAVADAAEVGLALEPVREIELRAAAFGAWIDREAIFDHVSNTNVERDSTRRLGAELSLAAEPIPWVALRADAAYVDARFERSGNPIPGTAPWSGRAAVRLGLARGPHGDANLDWAGRRDLAHGAAVSGQALLDAGAGWRFEHFDVSVILDNVLNSRAMDGAYHYASWFDRDTPRSALPAIHCTAASPLAARVVLTAWL